MTERSENVRGLGRRAIFLSIAIYQRAVSPLLGQNCRYHPTCSNYTYEAVESFGVARGSWMAIKRIGRCHPFKEGGYDPVPSNREDGISVELGGSL